MNIKSEIYEYLIAQTPLTDLVGTRIYSQAAPKSAGDSYIVIQEIAQQTVRHSLAASSLTRSTIQFTIVGSSPSQVDSITDALREELDGFTGGTMGTTTVERVDRVSPRDNYLPPQHGQEFGLFSVIDEYYVHYRQSVPTFA